MVCYDTSHVMSEGSDVAPLCRLLPWHFPLAVLQLIQLELLPLAVNAVFEVPVELDLVLWA